MQVLSNISTYVQDVERRQSHTGEKTNPKTTPVLERLTRAPTELFMTKTPFYKKVSNIVLFAPLLGLGHVVANIALIVRSIFYAIPKSIGQSIKNRTIGPLGTELKAICKHINDFIRRAFAMIPVVGLFIAKGFDMLEIMAQDTGEIVVSLASRIKFGKTTHDSALKSALR